MFKFLMKPKRPPLEKIETYIGRNTSFEGHLKCDGNVRIDGVCAAGVIETVGNVVVAPGARVAAKIVAEHVSVAGEVTGEICARGYLEILSTGRVSADVRVANFHKDETGVLSGKLIMGDEARAISELTALEEAQGNQLIESDSGPSPPLTQEESQEMARRD